MANHGMLWSPESNGYPTMSTNSKIREKSFSTPSADAAGSLAERHDIAELVSNSSAEFFAEAKLELFVACSKFSASDALPLQVIFSRLIRKVEV